MNRTNKIQLQTSSILKVPLNTYNDEFIFKVNGEEFKTTRLISDLLSPKISHIHNIDPTISEYTITTRTRGNFSHILELVDFREKTFSKDELSFIAEVTENLNNEFIHIEISSNDEDEEKEITINKVIELISEHEKYPLFYHQRLAKEIEYLRSHLYEIDTKLYDSFKGITRSTLEQIFSNDTELRLKDEDQLIEIINHLYASNKEYSNMYEYVNFVNATIKSINEFLMIFDYNDMTRGTWEVIKRRMSQEIKKENKLKEEVKRRHQFSSEQEFSGIINYLYTTSNGNIDNEINITSSGNQNGNNEYYLPRTVALFNDDSRFFISTPQPNSWICFDFKNHRIIPTDYSIKKSKNHNVNSYNSRSWVIEVSNDNESFEIIDEVKNDSEMNTSKRSKTFKIKQAKSNEYRYLRLRQTGPNWSNGNNKYDHFLIIDSFEIYGTLI